MIAQKKKKTNTKLIIRQIYQMTSTYFKEKKRFQNHIKQAYSSRTLAKVSSKSVIIE